MPLTAEVVVSTMYTVPDPLPSTDMEFTTLTYCSPSPHHPSLAAYHASVHEGRQTGQGARAAGTCLRQANGHLLQASFGGIIYEAAPNKDTRR